MRAGANVSMIFIALPPSPPLPPSLGHKPGFIGRPAPGAATHPEAALEKGENRDVCVNTSTRHVWNNLYR